MVELIMDKYIVIGIKRSSIRYIPGEYLDTRTNKNVSRIDPASIGSIHPVILSGPISYCKASRSMVREYATRKYDSVQIVKVEAPQNYELVIFMLTILGVIELTLWLLGFLG